MDLSSILLDPIQFISRLKIVNKEGRLVYLKPNREQIKIIQALQEGKDTLILKPRQIGSSTIVCAYFFWKAYTAQDPITLAILSHKLASSKHLLEISKKFYYNLPKSLKTGLSTDNTTEFRFSNGAGIIAVSAEAKGGLRSFTCSALHISEYAFAENPEELKATAIAALNSGQLVIESTANYFNDALHQEVLKFERGLVEYKYLFFPWYDHEEYLTSPEEDTVWTSEETSLMKELDLSPDQTYWRRKKIEKIGLDKFTREYPTSLEQAYRQIGNSYFTASDLKDINIVQVEPVEAVILQAPTKDDRYAVGIDVGGGVNRDFSVIQVFSKTTYSQVAIYRSNRISPVALANIIEDLSVKYNDALVLIEGNNVGAVTINELNHNSFSNFWTDDDGKDWLTTGKTKPLMFENLKSLIRSGHIKSLDNITFAEIRSLQVNMKGIIEIPENLGSHGDSAIALALAMICLEKVQLPKQAFLPNWIHQQKAHKISQKAGIAVGNHRRY